MKLSKSLEDYLESILFLQEGNNPVRLTDISTALEVTKPSASKAVKRLEEKGFVEHENYGGIFLTKAGLVRAGKIKKKHYMLMKFLTDVLDVEEKTAEADACKLEHAISLETEKKLGEFLDFLENSDNFHRELCKGCYADWKKKLKS